MLVRKLSGVALIASLASLGGCSSEVGDAGDMGTYASPILSSVTFASPVNVEVVGASLTKTGLVGWNAGAVSVESLAGDGAVEFTTAESNKAKMGGLSNGDSDQGYADIDFALLLSSTGAVQVYESGVNRGTVSSYVANDVFRVEVAGGLVRYLKNGSLLYTSAVAPTAPLLFDCSLSGVGATIQNVNLGQDIWVNEVGVNASGSDLTKTGAIGWNAGASSSATIAIDGFVQFTSGEATRAKMAGLSSDDAGQDYADIDYALFLSSTGALQIYEAGTSRGSFGTYVAGDLFKVAVAEGAVSYYKNGVAIYTSAVAPTLPLRFDCSLNQTGGTLLDLTVAETYWQNAVGVQVSGSDLTKTLPNGWNAGASTVRSIAGDGAVEFTTNESNRAKLAGLSNGDSGVGYADVDFGVLLSQTGAVLVYESGVKRGSFGNYVAGDVFKVEVVGGIVQYLKNGVLFYTSSAAPTLPLVFDASLNGAGATVNDVVVTG